MAGARRNAVLFSAIISSEIFKKILTNIVEEMESVEEMENVEYIEVALLVQNIQRIRGKQKKPPRITGFIENVIPRYNSIQFRRHFRMVPEVFESLENRIGPLLFDAESLGRPAISVRTQLLSTIWLLGTPDSFRYYISKCILCFDYMYKSASILTIFTITDFCCRSVSEKFDLSKSSLNACVRRVVQALNSIAGEVIKWPTGIKLAASREKFTHLGDARIPGVIGAIDGCYIFIKKPHLEVIHFFS